MSKTRPWVEAFADEMERKLDENRHKGDRSGWAKESPRWLLSQLKAEIRELERALGVPCECCGDGYHAKVSPSSVRSECADVANFAMMIADVAGGLKPKHQGQAHRGVGAYRRGMHSGDDKPTDRAIGYDDARNAIRALAEQGET